MSSGLENISVLIHQCTEGGPCGKGRVYSFLGPIGHDNWKQVIRVFWTKSGNVEMAQICTFRFKCPVSPCFHHHFMPNAIHSIQRIK